MTFWRKRGTERGTGRVSVGGDSSYSAIGPYSSVVVQQAAAPQGVAWPLEVGAVPALASAFQPRAGLRERIDAVREEGATAVLTQVLSGGGGVGKSQLAASYASQAVAEGMDLVVWAPAAELQQVVTRFAEAGVRVAASGVTGADPEADARAFLAWLATTSRRWLVVLDDIADPGAVEGWWPVSRTGSGWVLATTRLHDARLTGGGRRRVSVDVYEPDEAAAYLRARLAEDDGLVDGAVDELAGALGYLPLALGHAAAYMINHGLGCAAYLELFRGSRSITDVLPPSADAEGYGRAIATTLLLSLEAAETADPAGVARRVLSLAALLDPAGHPEALWGTEAMRSCLGDRDPAAALRVLHRYGLLSCDAGVVRIHALTVRAVREAIPEEDAPSVAVAAADGLFEMWPSPDQPHRDLAAMLRANTESLAEAASEHLWRPDGHVVLFRAGHSLNDAGLIAAATVYWTDLAAACERVLGADHPDTLSALASLAVSHWHAGRTDEAIALEEGVLADRERLLGPEHTDTLISRGNLASSYRQAGRLVEATELQEQVLAVRERVGADDHETSTVRSNLVLYYLDAGLISKAVTHGELALAESERVRGVDHPGTLVSRNNLAVSYHAAGRLDEAAALKERGVADSERILGPDHPDTALARGNLAVTYWAAGRTGPAMDLLARAATDLERLLGPGHPDTAAHRQALALMRARSRPLWRRVLGL
ncbi:tetratricopeptide repeat protein [Streptomyces sp. NPDC052494]|uniref:tetratricopeptide repeat protein n=1 Tax=Streptomyces sp. NPDC052494 TaxID=3365692 RepID=UPI0037D1E235